MGLSNLTVKNAIAKDKPYKLYDGNGLYVFVTPAGGKYWKMRYSFAGKERKYAVGTYPAMGIAEARKEVVRLKEMLARGEVPTPMRVTAKTRLFRDIAEEWWRSRNGIMDAKTQKNTRYRLDKHILPALGDIPPERITAKDVVQMGLAIQKSGADSVAARCINIVSLILRPLVFSGDLIADVTINTSKALKSYNGKNNPHLDAKKLPAFLKALDNHSDTISRKAAWFLLHTLVRTSEMRFATLDEFDFEKQIWRIPAQRMKSKRPHLVPLTEPVLDIIQSLPCENGRLFPVSENAVLCVIEAVGYKGIITGHGFRSTASTILNEHSFSPDAIEAQLAHASRGVRAVYNHAQYLPERARMMTWWSDYLLQNKQ
ncbi:MAG: DUF4102 domain-containing protein [Alphaproteobacteria bacterium]|nr:MAG: DUF4102 domain-containing protein [Alphaproteobacteria bacterium]